MQPDLLTSAWYGYRGQVTGNYIDVETGEEYWISGVKKNGTGRHWAGSGPIYIDKDVVEEYLLIRGLEKLDPKQYLLIDSIVPTDIEKFTQLENESEWYREWKFSS